METIIYFAIAVMIFAVSLVAVTAAIFVMKGKTTRANPSPPAQKTSSTNTWTWVVVASSVIALLFFWYTTPADQKTWINDKISRINNDSGSQPDTAVKVATKIAAKVDMKGAEDGEYREATINIADVALVIMPRRTEENAVNLCATIKKPWVVEEDDRPYLMVTYIQNPQGRGYLYSVSPEMKTWLGVKKPGVDSVRLSFYLRPTVLGACP